MSLIGWPANFCYCRLKEKSVNALWTHPTKDPASLQNAVKGTELGSSLCNEISCWRWLDIKLFVTLSIVQTLLDVTFVCSLSWRKTPGESRFEDIEKTKEAVTFNEDFTKWLARYNKSIEVRASLLWRMLQFCTSLKFINISAEEVSKLLKCTAYFGN